MKGLADGGLWVKMNTSPIDTTPQPVIRQNHSTLAGAYFQHEVTYLLWLTVPPVLLVLGCFGNVMTIVVMRGMRASESTACLSVYFTALAVSDLIIITFAVLWYWPQTAWNSSILYFHDISCTGFRFVIYVSSLTSAWSLVAMTCQRLMSVLVPHRVVVLCTVRKGKMVTALIVTLSCVVNVHFFFHYSLDAQYQSCVSDNEVLVNIFGFLDLCLASLIPFLFLLVANSVLIFRTMASVRFSGKMTAGSNEQRKTSQSVKVSSMTVTLILVSAAFLLLTMPICILNIYYEMIGFYSGGIVDEDTRQQLAFADTICLLMGMSNSVINFYIYVLSGRRFRVETKKCLSLCFKHHQQTL